MEDEWRSHLEIDVVSKPYMELSNGEPRSNAEAKKVLRKDKQREEAFSGMKLDEKYEIVFKRLTELEKETVTLKARWESNNDNVQKMLDDQIDREKQFTKTRRQLAQLQKLCRTPERTTYLAALKETNVALPSAAAKRAENSDEIAPGKEVVSDRSQQCNEEGTT